MRKSKTRVLGTEGFRRFSHLIKSVVSVVMPPTNRHPNECLDKAVWEIRGKRKARAQYLFFFPLDLVFNHKNPILLDRQENEA